jgi:hypothetical protein
MIRLDRKVRMTERTALSRSVQPTGYISPEETPGNTNLPRSHWLFSSVIIASVAIAWFAAVGLQASGAVIFANYDGVNALSTGRAVQREFDSSLGSWKGFRTGVAFTTDANSYSLDSVMLNIYRVSGTSSLILGLYDGVGNAPGSNLGTFLSPDIGFTPTNYTFTATGLTLQPETTYWIVAEPSLTAESDFAWASAPSNLTGYDMAILSTSGSSWGSWVARSNLSPTLLVSGTLQTVPEPSVFAMLALGTVALLGGLRMRRR